MKKNIHINTTLSNQDMDSKTRCGQIVQFFIKLGWGCVLTDREVMQGMGFKDMNAVRPRITELLAKKILEENGSTRDHETKRYVRKVRLISQQLKLF